MIYETIIVVSVHDEAELRAAMATEDGMEELAARLPVMRVVEVILGMELRRMESGRGFQLAIADIIDVVAERRRKKRPRDWGPGPESV